MILVTLPLNPLLNAVDMFQLYDRLRKERPNFLSKIRIVEGEISNKNLCISEEDRQMLINEVDKFYYFENNVTLAW